MSPAELPNALIAREIVSAHFKPEVPGKYNRSRLHIVTDNGVFLSFPWKDVQIEKMDINGND